MVELKKSRDEEKDKIKVQIKRVMANKTIKYEHLVQTANTVTLQINCTVSPLPPCCFTKIAVSTLRC